MKKTLLSLAGLVLFLISFSQGYDPEKINKKAVAIYNQALEKAQGGNYKDAISLLIQSINTDSKYIDAYLSLAGVYGQTKDYPNSVAWYEKAFAQDSDYTVEYKLPYSINLAGMGEFDKALTAINSFFEKNPPKNTSTYKAAEYRKKSYEFATWYAHKHRDKDYVFAPKNLGDSINSTESEYFPSLTIDGSEMVFTRRIGGFNEDFFFSKKNNEKRGLAKPLQGDINKKQNKGDQNI